MATKRTPSLHMSGYSMTSTQSQRLTKSYYCMAKTLQLLFVKYKGHNAYDAWEVNGISSIKKTY